MRLCWPLKVYAPKVAEVVVHPGNRTCANQWRAPPAVPPYHQCDPWWRRPPQSSDRSVTLRPTPKPVIRKISVKHCGRDSDEGDLVSLLQSPFFCRPSRHCPNNVGEKMTVRAGFTSYDSHAKTASWNNCLCAPTIITTKVYEIEFRSQRIYPQPYSGFMVPRMTSNRAFLNYGISLFGTWLLTRISPLAFESTSICRLAGLICPFSPSTLRKLKMQRTI